METESAQATGAWGCGAGSRETCAFRLAPEGARSVTYSNPESSLLAEVAFSSTLQSRTAATGSFMPRRRVDNQSDFVPGKEMG